MSIKFPTVESIKPVLKKAGDAIMEVYLNDEFKVAFKADNSPLTKADLAANKIIEEYLLKNFSFPVISEEGEQLSYEERKGFDFFWLVDPLDGTKEFVNRNGEFTVNIALIHNGIPVFGGIYVPVQDTYYFGIWGEGAYKYTGNRFEGNLTVRNKTEDWIAVGSKSHAQAEEQLFFDGIKVKETVAVGSSLKFCLIAEGKADIYYRSGPTMEWDTAAGHAIVRAAGGEMYKDKTAKEVFTYNKENLLNGSFLCASNRNFV